MVGQGRLAAAHPARSAVESCWMCGIRLSTEWLMPDGGRACADIRWYCRDARACTERWTSRAPGSVTVRPAASGSAAGLSQPAARGAGPKPVTMSGPTAVW
jgi:hypothetical protein